VEQRAARAQHPGQLVVEGLRVQLAGNAETRRVVQHGIEAGIRQRGDGGPRRAMMKLQAPAVLGRIRVGRPRVERAQPQHVAVVLLEGDDARGAGIERAAK
jgi:hypothetical protein